MQIPNVPEAQALLNQYLFHHLTSSYSRQELRKKFTAYNRTTTGDKLAPAMLIADRFPTLFAYVKAKYPNVPEDQLFERNFGKLINNLNILPSIRTYKRTHSASSYSVYDSLTSHYIITGYTGKNATFHNSITDKIYTIDANGVFTSTDGLDSFSVYDLKHFLTVVREL